MQTELYDALIEAGATEDKARAAAGSLTDYCKMDEVAAKADLNALEARLTWCMVVISGILSTLIIGSVSVAAGVIIAFLSPNQAAFAVSDIDQVATKADVAEIRQSWLILRPV